MVQSQFSLTWDSYKSNICTGFSTLQQNGELVDMTLAAEGHFVKVHQVLIALSSPYLKQLILSAPCQHPVIFLNNMSHGILSLLLEYIYTGEVLVPSANLLAFIDAAKSLHIKGLESVVEGNSKETNILLNLENSGRTGTSTKMDTNNSEQITLPTNARKIFVKQKNEPVATTEAKKQIWNMPTVSTDMQNYSVLINDSATENNDSFNYSNIHSQTKEDLAKVSSNLQFTVSIRGSLQVILNRYIYNLHSSQSSGVRRWRCIDYRNKKCSAFVVTNGNIVINRANPHNHSFHDKKILDKIEKNAVYTALDEVQNYIDKEKAKDRDESMESESVPMTFATSLSMTSEGKTFQIVDDNS